MSCRLALTAHSLTPLSVPEAESTRPRNHGHLGASEDGHVLQVGLDSAQIKHSFCA